MERLKKLEKEGWNFAYKMQSEISDVIQERGGHINLLEIRKEKDGEPTRIYAYAYDEDRDEYRECIINEIKVEIDDNNERRLCIKVEFEDKCTCECESDDNWYHIFGRCVLALPTMFELCRYLSEYID